MFDELQNPPRYRVGNTPTEADWRLFAPLAR